MIFVTYDIEPEEGNVHSSELTDMGHGGQLTETQVDLEFHGALEG